MVLISSALVASVLAAPFSIPSPQVTATAVGPQVERPAQIRRGQAFTVDPSGLGDFADLATAIAAVPARSLLLLKSGIYAGVVVDRKSLRIESEMRHGVQFSSPLVVQNLGPNQDVYLSGLFFQEGFRLRSCDGEVSLFDCAAIEDGVPATPPLDVYYSDCGAGLSRHIIESCDAVTLVNCLLEGRDGFQQGIVGTPGEHALVAVDSTVALYDGRYRGGDGADARPATTAFAGAGGDALQVQGMTARVLLNEVDLRGGAGGLDVGDLINDGCPGSPVRIEDGGTTVNTTANAAFLELGPMARPGTLVPYRVTGPIGAEVFLKIGRRRGWREFPARAGVFHLASPFHVIPLGTLGSTGFMTGTLAAPSPQWAGGFIGLECQVHARINGLDRFSEPRTLHVTAVR